MKPESSQLGTSPLDHLHPVKKAVGNLLHGVKANLAKQPRKDVFEPRFGASEDTPDGPKPAEAVPDKAPDWYMADFIAERPDYKALVDKGQAVPKEMHYNMMRSHPFRYDAEFNRAAHHCVNTSEQSGKPAKLLIIGVANGEEPIAYLSQINHLKAPGKTLKESLDLTTVDIRPRDEIQLETLTKYVNHDAESSFTEVTSGEYEGCYQLKEDLCDYLTHNFNDPEKSHWRTDMRHFLADKLKAVEAFEAHDTDPSTQPPKEDHRFDVVSCNNVIKYLPDEDKLKNRYNLMKLVKPGGLLIMDPDDYVAVAEFRSIFKEHPELANQFEKVNVYKYGTSKGEGVYRRIA